MPHSGLKSSNGEVAESQHLDTLAFDAGSYCIVASTGRITSGYRQGAPSLRQISAEQATTTIIAAVDTATPDFLMRPNRTGRSMSTVVSAARTKLTARIATLAGADATPAIAANDKSGQ